jgi:hypothetical protein
MKYIIRNMRWFIISLIIILLIPVGCKKSASSTGPENTENSDIPSDPTTTIPTTTINNIIPSATFTKVSGNEIRIQVNLLGIIDPTTGQTIELNTANLFVVEDGVLQGIKVSPVGGDVTLKADVVFVVDNSGSMSEEADSIASKIIAFCNFLQSNGLDIKVGSVGYAYGINGAHNLTDPASLMTYLNQSTGVYRTRSFGGSDSASLGLAISAFYNSKEDGIPAIAFADSLFSWRSSATRVYVNFTDEAIQPNNPAIWSVADFVNRWNSLKGTIHTVFSLYSSYWSGSVPDTTMEHENHYSWTPGVAERPWTLSNLTGGTTKFIHSDATDLNLPQLPVTGALTGSYLVEYITSNPNTSHTVTIIVKTTGADGKAIFTNVTY